MRVNVSASEVRVRTVPAASNPPGKLIDNPIGVMFSGGMDSTLTAAVLADRFRNIHLVTYGMGRQLQFMSNALYHVHELKKILGEDRIHHEFVDNNEIFSELKKGFIRDYVEYCNNKAPFIHCLKCKFSMHARSIIYCLENGLKYWADGAIEAQNDRPEMMPGVLKLLEGLYAQYGIELSSPVYYYGSRDDERRERDEEERSERYEPRHLCRPVPCSFGLHDAGNYSIGKQKPRITRGFHLTHLRELLRTSS